MMEFRNAIESAIVCGAESPDVRELAHPEGRLLFTVGCGSFPMTPPASLREESEGLYAEFALLLPLPPSGTDDRDARNLLLRLSERVQRGEWIGYGHLLPIDCPLSDFVAVTFYPLTDGEGRDIVVVCDDGRAVAVYLVVPLLPSELEFRLSTDAADFYRRISTVVADAARDRPNILKHP